jgi:hypothetical protein
MLAFQDDRGPVLIFQHIPDYARDGEDLIEIFLIEERFVLIGEADQAGRIDGNGCAGYLGWEPVGDMIKIPIYEQPCQKEEQ